MTNPTNAPQKPSSLPTAFQSFAELERVADELRADVDRAVSLAADEALPDCGGAA